MVKIGFNPREQERLASNAFDPFEVVSAAINVRPPWDSIVDFATHRSFCGFPLFPRQATLLKLIFLETESMTQFDLDTIENWRRAFEFERDVYGVQPDIWYRVEYLKKRGYRRFPHIQMVLGRRASKGALGGILGCEQVAYIHTLDNPQRHYGIAAGKDVYLNVGATSQTQASRQLFADVRTMIEDCRYFSPEGKPSWIAESKDNVFRVRTPADLRRIADLKARRQPIDHQIASLVGVALSASSVAGRGATSFCLDPETPVLTADLRWVPIKSVVPGDEVVGVDEFAVEKGRHRKVRVAQVLAKATTRKKAYRLTFDNGRSVTCSGDHRWLIRRSIGEFRWRPVKGKSSLQDIKVGDEIFELVEPWGVDDSREAGYLAGVYDGEGSLGTKNVGGISVFFSQNPGVVLDDAMRMMKEKGFSPQPQNSNAYLKRVEKRCQQWAIRGMAECLRFLGQIRPSRLVAKAPQAYEGVSVRGKGSTRYAQPTHRRKVVRIEELTEQTLVDIQTTTGTFIANGVVSHNCNMFDEFAFHVQTGSSKSDDQIYKDWQPSLGQFDIDALTYIPSSPACLQPSTPVLTEDLRWVPVGSLCVGDRLIGFDEYPEPGKGRARTWRPTVVTETSVFNAPRYELVTEGGKHITSTDDHLWLVRRVGGMGRGKGRGQRSQNYPQKFCWVKTIDLRPGDQIKSLGVELWETDESRDGGYLAGVFDADGHLAVNGKQLNLGFTQLPGQAYDHVRTLLKERGFEVRNNVKLAYTDCRGVRSRDINKDRILGGFPEIMRFLGSIRPERLSLSNFLNRLYGSRIYSNGGHAVDRVVSVKRVDDGPVVALGTSTSTLVAEGLLSHNTKAGQFYVIYEQGKVLMPEYVKNVGDASGMAERARQNLMNVGVTNEVESGCDPTWLIFQGPSWGLYQGWEDYRRYYAAASIPVWWTFNKTPEPDLTSERQQREQIKDPDKFRVEKLGQFSEVQDQYLDSDKVRAMFDPPTWRGVENCEICNDDGIYVEKVDGRTEVKKCLHPLVPQYLGSFARKYRIHCDPGLSGANFSLAIAHLEDAPPDQHGVVWPHVVFDYLHVWRPMDFPPDPETKKRHIDYVKVHNDIEDVLKRFMSTERISFDQWNSASFIASLKQKFMPDIRVSEVTFTDKENQQRCEKFKSALNLGWLHCLSAETLVLTPDGARPIGELAGGTHKVLTTCHVDGRGGGKWVNAPISSFGVQPLMKVTLRRNGVDKVIHATDGHRWFVRRNRGTGHYRDEVLTKDLRPGQRLSYCYAQRHTQTVPSPIGIAHGFTFGDGTRSRKGSVAQFCGDKDKALIPYFDLHRIVDVAPGIRRALNLPCFFKERVDLSESPSYLYGWLAGYMAADGHVTRDGRVEIDSVDLDNMEHVRTVCNLLGIHTTSIRTKPGYGTGYKDSVCYAVNLDRGSLTESFFLIEEHRNRWLDNQSRPAQDYKGYTVVSVEATDRVEEVFCAEVPNTHSFTLDDNILTGNCYRDKLYRNDHDSLLELELSFLSLAPNGKVVKQEIGPVTTKDLADAVMVVTTDLLHDALDRWSSGRMTAGAFGSTNARALKSPDGHEYDRIAEGIARENKAWRKVETAKLDRAVTRRRGGRHEPDRLSSIHQRRK